MWLVRFIAIALLLTALSLAACSNNDDEIAELEMQLAAAQQEAADLAQQRDDLDEEVDGLQDQLTDFQRSLDDAEDDIDDALSERNRTDAENRGLEMRLAELETALVEALEGPAPLLSRDVLERMALNLEDLPDGVSINQETFEVDDDGDAEFDRRFNVILVPIGTSNFIALANEVRVVRNAEIASVFIGAIIAAFSDDPSQIFNAFADGPAFGEIETEVIPAELGDEAVVLRMTGDSVIGEIAIDILLMRVENIIATITAVGAGEQA